MRSTYKVVNAEREFGGIINGHPHRPIHLFRTRGSIFQLLFQIDRGEQPFFLSFPLPLPPRLRILPRGVMIGSQILPARSRTDFNIQPCGGGRMPSIPQSS